MGNSSAKLKHAPNGVEKRDRSWFIKLEDGKTECVPLSVITSHNPVTRIVEIETWWLDKKEIKYKV